MQISKVELDITWWLICVRMHTHIYVYTYVYIVREEGMDQRNDMSQRREE